MGETCKLKECVGQMLAWNDLTPLLRRTVSGLLFGPPRKVLWRRGAPLTGWWRHSLEWCFFFRWILSKWRNFLDFWVNDVVYQLIRSSTKSRTQEFHILSINCSWSQQHERASRCWQHPSIQFQNKEQRLKPYQQHPATKTYSCASCRANTPSSPPSQSTQHQNTWQIGARMLQCFSDFQCQDLAIWCSPFWIIIHCLIQYDYHDTISLGRRNQSIWGHFPFWSWLRGAGTSS